MISFTEEPDRQTDRQVPCDKSEDKVLECRQQQAEKKKKRYSQKSKSPVQSVEFIHLSGGRWLVMGEVGGG